MPDILHQFQIKQPAETVFDIFTSPSGLNAWWTLEADGKPELHEIYRLNFGPQYDWRAKVIHLIPAKALTWQMTQAMDDWLPTQVGFSLTESENGCTVHFFHRNWPDASDHFAVSNYCWGQLLQGLKDFAEQGVVIPFVARN